MACAYEKEGEKCFIGNNTLTAGGGHGGLENAREPPGGN